MFLKTKMKSVSIGHAFLTQVCIFLQLTTNSLIEAGRLCPPAFPNLGKFFIEIQSPSLQQTIQTSISDAQVNCTQEVTWVNLDSFNVNRCNETYNYTKPVQCLPGYTPPTTTTSTESILTPSTVIASSTKSFETTITTIPVRSNQTAFLPIYGRKENVSIALIVGVAVLAAIVVTFIVAMALYRYCMGRWCCDCCGVCPQKRKELSLEKIPGVYYINHAALGDISNQNNQQVSEEGVDGMLVYANPFITNSGKSGVNVTPQARSELPYKENGLAVNGTSQHNKKQPVMNGFTPHRKMKIKRLQKPTSALETVNPVEMGYYVDKNPAALDDSNANDIFTNNAAILEVSDQSDATLNAQFSTVERQNRQNIKTEMRKDAMDDPEQWVPSKKNKKGKSNESFDDFCISNDWAMENEISEVTKPNSDQSYI